MLYIMRNKIILEYNEILLKINEKIILFIFLNLNCCIVVKFCLVNWSVFF